MNALILFQDKDEDLFLSQVSEVMGGLLGLDCTLLEEDGQGNGTSEAAEAPFHGGTVRVNFPDVDEETDGAPLVMVKVVPRGDRDSDLTTLLDEILSQDPSLKGAFTENARDYYLFHEDTPASSEAAYLLAYILAMGTSSGVLVPSAEEEMETLWFDNPEDFGDVIFGDEEDDEGGEEGEDW